MYACFSEAMSNPQCFAIYHPPNFSVEKRLPSPYGVDAPGLASVIFHVFLQVIGHVKISYQSVCELPGVGVEPPCYRR
jgi:hypothetical protein